MCLSHPKSKIKKIICLSISEVNSNFYSFILTVRMKVFGEFGDFEESKRTIVSASIKNLTYEINSWNQQQTPLFLPMHDNVVWLVCFWCIDAFDFEHAMQKWAQGAPN